MWVGGRWIAGGRDDCELVRGPQRRSRDEGALPNSLVQAEGVLEVD